MVWEISSNPLVFPDPPCKDDFCNVPDRAFQLKLSQAHDHLLFQWQGINEFIRLANILIPPVIKYNGEILMVSLIRQGLEKYSQCLTQRKVDINRDEIVEICRSVSENCAIILNADDLNVGSINVFTEVNARVLNIAEIFSQVTVSQNSAHVVSDLDDIQSLDDLIKFRNTRSSVSAAVASISSALQDVKSKLSKPQQLYHADEMLRNFLMAVFAAAKTGANFIVKDIQTGEFWSLDDELPLSVWIINRREMEVRPSEEDATELIAKLYTKIMPENIKRVIIRHEHEAAILSGSMLNCL